MNLNVVSQSLLVAFSAMACGLSLAQAVPLIQGPNNVRVVDADLLNDAMRVPAETRGVVFGKPDTVVAAASNLYVRRALAAEAEKSGLAQTPEIEALLRLARDRVLSDARLAQIDSTAGPKDEAALDRYAKQVYDANPEKYKGPEQVRVRHILLRKDAPGAREKAEQLLAELKGGADFAQKAKELSADPSSAAQGGDLGFFASGKMVPAFEVASFALSKPGELTPVVETQFGYHIIRLEEKRAAGVRPFDEVKPQLRAELRNSMVQEARAAVTDRILKEAQVNAEAVEAFAAKFR